MMKNTVLLLVLLLTVPVFAEQDSDTVKVWQEPLELPTYEVYPADVNPMFWNHQSYQGASKVIYPYPFQDNLSNIRKSKTYNALYLDNEYIKLCVLPELGGRLFYATDKTNGYEIFYRQHVIKPSNIGMLGAWISGGIEWCVFHHHRASTFMPVDYKLMENSDGSKTIWFGEIEPRQRMKWNISISLYPGKSYIEVQARMFNRTAVTNSFLYWANVATHVNDDYQIFFPPSTEFGTYHAKNYFTHWPISQERYLNRDYVGVDLSWWKNHPSPVSIFAHDLKDGFLAGYDHGKRAGTVHVANPHIVKGAKLWEWGPGEVGKMWDSKVLTDTDGPYAELMTGAYSDNQPDYSWIKPYEVKQCRQYWYPIRDIGGTKAANINAALNLEIKDQAKVLLGLNVTQKQKNAHVVLKAKEETLIDSTVDISPVQPFVKEITLPAGVKETDLHATLLTESGQELISYTPVVKETDTELPITVKQPAAPEDIKTIEELYLTGLRIKQFHNARLNPNDYFEEVLKRDPNDSRCNIQLGIYYAQKGLYNRSIEHLTKAIDRIGKDYTRPRDCEAYYHLGLVLKRQGNYDQAYENLYRAAWDYPFRSAAYYNLAEISCLRGQFEQALEEVDNSLITNTVNTKALNLKSAILRKLDRNKEANQLTTETLKIDPLDYWACNEKYLALKEMGRKGQAAKQLAQLKIIMRDYAESYLELATDYIASGFYDEAANVLSRAVRMEKPGLSDYPTIHYYIAYLSPKQGNQNRAKRFYKSARECPTDYCFPFRLETIDILSEAIEQNPHDAKAYYYLGNLLYDLQPEKAIEQWEKAVKLDETMAIAHRNLGWGYEHAQQDIAKAISSYEKAIAYNPQDPRYYYELDLLYENSNTNIDKRLATLESHHQFVQKREDSLIREIIVLTQAGKYDKAIEYLQGYFFHIQEGNRRLHETHVDAYLMRGLERFAKKDYKAALDDFLMANEYPENHQIGRDRDYDRNVQINYYLGECYESLGQSDKAKEYFKKVTGQDIRDSEYIYYQARAYQKSGDADKASEIFGKLIDLGEKRTAGTEDVDFFAKFGQGEAARVRTATGHYMMALGYLGKTQTDKARESLEKAVELDVNNIWARYQLEQLK